MLRSLLLISIIQYGTCVAVAAENFFFPSLNCRPQQKSVQCPTASKVQADALADKISNILFQGHNQSLLDKACFDRLQRNAWLLPTRQPTTIKVTPHGENRGSCGFHKILVASYGTNREQFMNVIENTNWDPCCVPGAIDTFIRKGGVGNRPLNGYSFSIGGGPDAGVVSGTGAREIVVLGSKNGTVKFSVVASISGTLGVGVPTPVNVEATWSVLYGKCLKAADYLGWFVTGTVGVVGINRGLSGLPGKSARSYCDSSSLTASLPEYAATSASYYWAITPEIEIAGPRAAALAEYLSSNGRKGSSGKACEKKAERNR